MIQESQFPWKIVGVNQSFENLSWIKTPEGLGIQINSNCFQ